MLSSMQTNVSMQQNQVAFSAKITQPLLKHTRRINQVKEHFPVSNPLSQPQLSTYEPLPLNTGGIRDTLYSSAETTPENFALQKSKKDYVKPEIFHTRISIEEPLCHTTPSHIESGTLNNGDRVSVTSRDGRKEIDIWINGKQSHTFYDYDDYLNSDIYKQLHSETGRQDNVSKECFRKLLTMGGIVVAGIFLGAISHIRRKMH